MEKHVKCCDVGGNYYELLLQISKLSLISSEGELMVNIVTKWIDLYVNAFALS